MKRKSSPFHVCFNPVGYYVGCSGVANGESAMLTGKSPLLRIHKVRLRVRDLSQSVAFYAELLGLQEKPERAHSGNACECVAHDPHCEEFGITFSQGFSDDVVPSAREQVSFEVATIEEAAALYAKAREMGAQAIQPRLFGGCWRTFIFDPDGHKLEVVAKEAQMSQGTAG
jgi:catechol 2,3-dioxygenase-like lactoylglutathione lyase family enzyme